MPHINRTHPTLHTRAVHVVQLYHLEYENVPTNSTTGVGGWAKVVNKETLNFHSKAVMALKVSTARAS